MLTSRNTRCLQLFQGKPDEDFLKNGWRDDGVFADPITETKVRGCPSWLAPSSPHRPLLTADWTHPLIPNVQGYGQFAPQWYGLAKLFSQSETLAYKVITDQPNLSQSSSPEPLSDALPPCPC